MKKFLKEELGRWINPIKCVFLGFKEVFIMLSPSWRGFTLYLLFLSLLLFSIDTCHDKSMEKYKLQLPHDYSIERDNTDAN